MVFRFDIIYNKGKYYISEDILNKFLSDVIPNYFYFCEINCEVKKVISPPRKNKKEYISKAARINVLRGKQNGNKNSQS